MSRFSGYSREIPSYSDCDSQAITGSAVDMCFKITAEGGDVPILAFHDAESLWGSVRTTLEPNQFITVIAPLIVNTRDVKTCTGADTILKSFTNRFGRLNQTITPKGEIYYGAAGLILDKDLKPILYITKKLTLGDEPPATTVHVSPSVFTDDVSTLHKAILKKGIAYYLTNSIGNWGQNVFAKIVIDNGADIFRLPNKPNPAIPMKEINSLLKDNIAEVLRQVQDDSRHI